jgi:hypothetical protein
MSPSHRRSHRLWVCGVALLFSSVSAFGISLRLWRRATDHASNELALHHELHEPSGCCYSSLHLMSLPRGRLVSLVLSRVFRRPPALSRMGCPSMASQIQPRLQCCASLHISLCDSRDSSAAPSLQDSQPSPSCARPSSLVVPRETCEAV